MLRRPVEQGNIIADPALVDPQAHGRDLDVFDFTLTDDEMKRICALKRADGRIANPLAARRAWD